MAKGKKEKEEDFIPDEGYALYYNITTSQVRKLKDESPEKYELMVSEYVYSLVCSDHYLEYLTEIDLRFAPLKYWDSPDSIQDKIEILNRDIGKCRLQVDLVNELLETLSQKLEAVQKTLEEFQAISQEFQQRSYIERFIYKYWYSYDGEKGEIKAAESISEWLKEQIANYNETRSGYQHDLDENIAKFNELQKELAESEKLFEEEYSKLKQRYIPLISFEELAELELGRLRQIIDLEFTFFHILYDESENIRCEDLKSLKQLFSFLDQKGESFDLDEFNMNHSKTTCPECRKTLSGGQATKAAKSEDDTLNSSSSSDSGLNKRKRTGEDRDENTKKAKVEHVDPDIELEPSLGGQAVKAAGHADDIEMVDH